MYQCHHFRAMNMTTPITVLVMYAFSCAPSLNSTKEIIYIMQHRLIEGTSNIKSTELNRNKS